jgi:hypothetical protein
VLVFIGTSGVAFAMFGRFVDNLAGNVLLGGLLAAGSFVVLLHPDNRMSMAAAAVVLPATLFGVWRHRQFAPAKLELQVQPAQ